jgi:hypothetical protein
MLRADHAETLKLIDRLCTCFAQSATDGDHPATRYGHQLESLRKKLSGLSDAVSALVSTLAHDRPLRAARPVVIRFLCRQCPHIQPPLLCRLSTSPSTSTSTFRLLARGPSPCRSSRFSKSPFRIPIPPRRHRTLRSPCRACPASMTLPVKTISALSPLTAGLIKTNLTPRALPTLIYKTFG